MKFLVLGLIVLILFIYRMGMGELSKTELRLYTIIVLLIIFRKSIFKR